MKETLHSAFVLHTRPYRDTSGLIDLLTQDYGRISLIAKGYRSGKKSLKAILQPFRKLLVSWSGKGELKTLTAAEEVYSEYGMPTGGILISGMYVNELMTRLTHPNDPCPELFILYENILKSLILDQQTEKNLRVYEKNLLEELGYGLQLTNTANGEPVQEGQTYHYKIEHGPVPVISQGGHELEVSGKSLLSLYNESLEEPEVLREIKSLMRHVLSFYLGGRPLESRKLYQDLKKYTG